jgi:hypothetical protein
MTAIANFIAAAHIMYFLFIVGGCVGIVVGAAYGWKWIRNPRFRFSHAAAVYIVVAESVFHIPCPLNTAEWQLRSQTHAAAEASSGVGGLLDQLLFHTISGRVLNLMYWSLAVLLFIAFFVIRPEFSHRRNS